MGQKQTNPKQSNSHRILIRKRRFYWTSFDPMEPVGTFDGHTFVRALSREKLLAKWRWRLRPRDREWEPIDLGTGGSSS